MSVIQVDLSIQCISDQNSSKLFCGYWPSDSQVYMERPKTQSCQLNIEREEQTWRTGSIRLQDLRQNYSHHDSVELYYLTLVRMAIVKKSTNNKRWRGCGEKGTLLHCWWECKLVQPLWKTVWRFLRKLKIELPYDPAIPLLGIYLEKTIIRKDTCTPMVHCSTICNIQDMEAT